MEKQPIASEAGERPGVPRWVKVAAFVAVVVVVIVVVLMLAGGGSHGPGRHGG